MARNSTKQMYVWIVDPIDYSGMAYYDAGLAGGLSMAGAAVCVIGTDERLVPRPADAAWRHRALFRGTTGDDRVLIRGGRYLLGLIRLLRAAKQTRPDAVIWQYLEVPAADLVVMRVLKSLRIPVVFVAHEVQPWSMSRLSRMTRRQVVRNADLVFAHGEPEADEIRRVYGLPPARVVVTGHGDYREFVDPLLTQTEARERLGIAEDAPVALFFGSLRPSKGLAHLLQAWPAVRDLLPEAQLLVVGRAPRGAAITGIPTRGVTCYSGAIPPQAVDEYFAAADLVVLPYERITTSGVMRHAFSERRPVVATAVGELARHVVPGETGWLVPPGDLGALAAAIADAMGDRAHTASMGRRACDYSLRVFDWATIGRASLDAIDHRA